MENLQNIESAMLQHQQMLVDKLPGEIERIEQDIANLVASNDAPTPAMLWVMEEKKRLTEYDLERAKSMIQRIKAIQKANTNQTTPN
jgi:dynactin complex subunit